MLTVLWLLKIAGLSYLGFGLLLYATQRSFMYLPTAEVDADDLAVEYVDNDGHRLKVWVVGPGDDGPAAIYFGGNAENVYFNAPDFRRWLPEHTVYLLHYRGYGGSTGRPSEAALFSDALALFDRIDERHAAIDVVGRSLGSGVAVYLASERPVERLVLVTPMDSALSLARAMYPVYPVDWLLKDRYESDRYAADVNAEALLITAEHDRLVPLRHAQSLLQAFPLEQARLVSVPGAGHNDLSVHAVYWHSISDFLRR
jgi:pimeloyl-ACP methyl ester carboxylesterase